MIVHAGGTFVYFTRYSLGAKSGNTLISRLVRFYDCLWKTRDVKSGRSSGFEEEKCPKWANKRGFCLWYFSMCCYSNGQSLVTLNVLDHNPLVHFLSISSFQQHSSWESVSLEGICCFILLHGPQTTEYLSWVWVVFSAAAKDVSQSIQKFNSTYKPEKVHHLVGGEAIKAQP